MGRRAMDMDKFSQDLVLIDDMESKKRLAKKIFDIGYKKGIYSSSISGLYAARGRGEFGGFCVPAINLRTLTYDLARAIIRVAKNNNSGAFIFEIAKSEIVYTNQPPVEYAALCVAAAVKEGYQGPIFIQGDHFQVNARKYKEDPEKEIGSLKTIIEEAIGAGFYNIDIDSSTLVDMSKTDIAKQQKLNYEVCALLTEHIRRIQPRGVEVSVGGEIGEVGKKNSSPEELREFMKGYRDSLRKNYKGISKISVQTGTSHGGVVLPDGSIAKVNLDFDTLRTLSKLAKEEFGLAGAVQHGASTLPSEAFHKFAETDTAEVHLATEFQNMVYDSEFFPQELRTRIYEWLKQNAADEKKEGETEEQFIYKTRKKALGPHKKDIMKLPQEVRSNIAKKIEEKFDFLFKQLNLVNKKELVDKNVALKRVIKRKHADKPGELVRDVEGDD
ncbi:MAG: class II fructose-bisphosphate aldolase [Candidatus Omnitrophica bacterium]|nr:class II fructose-bisphosphate aldolase [Candidatus Omnitrophota bacterium]